MNSRFKIADAHCDTMSKLLDCQIKGLNNTSYINFKELSYATLQVFAAFVNKNAFPNPLLRCVDIIDFYYREIDKNSQYVSHCEKLSDLQYISQHEKCAALLAVEGGEVLCGKLSVLNILYKLGVRILTLTWNYDNEISTCAASFNKGGLTNFGCEVVKQMNELGMIIDVSHLSQDGFWQVVDLSRKPIIASHSNAFSLCEHFRNLSNRQIEAIIKMEGFIGINFYPNFLKTGSKADIADIVKHIEYIIGMGGQHSVGFGTDFDGIDQLPSGIDKSQDCVKVIEQLLKLNYSEEIVKKIANGNFLAVLSNNFE